MTPEIARPRTKIMGVLNVTPDSFSDGGQFHDVDSAVEHATRMIDEGADIVDVGGESTRPGAEPVDAATEIARVLPVIEGIRIVHPDAVVSIDTTKALVARAALDAGATIVNDISGLGFDPEMARVVAEHRAQVVIMHIRGTPQTMRWSAPGASRPDDPDYDDVIEEIGTLLLARAKKAMDAGILHRNIIVDPGIGFGKTRAQNLEILRRLHELTALGFPIMVGTSRKSFIGAITGKDADDRVFGTAATVAVAVANGADIVRVHDVPQMLDVVRVAEAIRGL